MEIIINNFRSICDQKYKFTEGNNLVTGKSGLGKSTILEAVIWCFYGGTSVTPFNAGKKKIVTRVEVKIRDIIFIRTKPPDKSEVIIGNKKLEHAEAQEYINNFLGSKSLWETSSYLKQDNRSNMLFSSSQEKYSLVKELVFGREENPQSPENYLKTLSIFTENLEKEYNNTEGKLELMKENLKIMISDFNRFDEIEKNVKKLRKLNSKYSEIKEGIEKLSGQIIEQQTAKNYRKELEELNIKIQKYPKLNIEIIQKWRDWFVYKEELEKMDKNFPKINIDEYDEVDLVSDIKILILNRKKYKDNLTLCKKLNIEYDFNVIKVEIENLVSKIKTIKEREHHSDIARNIEKFQGKRRILLEKEGIYKDTYLQFLKKLDINGNKFTLENLNQVNNKLGSIMTNYLTCPKCSQNLILEDRKLIVKNCKFMKKEEIDKMKKNLKNIQIFYKSLDTINIELESYMKIKEKLGIKLELEETQEDWRKLEKRLDNLKTIEFYEFKENEVEEKENFIKNLKKNIKLRKLESLVEENYCVIFEEYEKPENLSKYYKEYQSLIFRLEEINKYLEDKDEKNIEDMTKKLNKFEVIIKDLDDLKIYEKILEKKERLNEISKINNEILKKREGCFVIKKIINEERSNTFENLIGNFNDLLNEIVGEIFDDINITIGMFKKMKAKGDIKPQFNMKVMLKGNEYDNLNFLSGGEKDRISIALTLTLSTLLNNPIIMFDESMSSLDEEMRERCLELIKKYASDKILINICHSTIEGYYDNIIRL